MKHTPFLKQNVVVEPIFLVKFLSKNYRLCQFNRRREGEKDEHHGVTGEQFSCLTHGQT
jgi:hypothetical protein